MFLGAFFSALIGALWILVKAGWENIDSRHPAKQFAQDAYVTIQADLGLASGNGTRLHHMRDKILGFKRGSRKNEI